MKLAVAFIIAVIWFGSAISMIVFDILERAIKREEVEK